MGALNGDDGVMLIAGTGTIGFALGATGHYRTGGWGFNISDMGSGAWIGHQAIRMALDFHDGLIDTGNMVQSIMQHFDNNPIAMVEWASQATPSDYGGLFKFVYQSADSGDKCAEHLLQQSADYVSNMVSTLQQKSNSQRWCFLGGVSPYLIPRLSGAVADTLVKEQGNALDGAILMAKKLKAGI